MIWVIIHSYPQTISLHSCKINASSLSAAIFSVNKNVTRFITVKKYGVYMAWVICILFNNITSVDLGEVWHRLNTPYACYCIIYNTFSATPTAWFPFSQLIDVMLNSMLVKLKFLCFFYEIDYIIIRIFGYFHIKSTFKNPNGPNWRQ